MLATLHGRTEAVRALLAHGADPNAADARGMTPLQAAFAGHQSDIAVKLGLAGARQGASTRPPLIALALPFGLIRVSDTPSRGGQKPPASSPYVEVTDRCDTSLHTNRRSGSIAVELSLTFGETEHMNLASRARLGT
jgi:ankyrin repeat protein